jgi:hypothetical protein
VRLRGRLSRGEEEDRDQRRHGASGRSPVTRVLPESLPGPNLVPTLTPEKPPPTRKGLRS